MLIEFDEHFDLRAEEVYPYFRSPRNWPRLYGSFGDVEDRGGGWFAVPLRGFPFPLVAKMTRDEPNRRVSWTFKGFWRGTGDIAFVPTSGGVTIRGYERISVRLLACASSIAERLFLERRFRQVWAYGWRRLRKQAEEPATPPTGTKPRP
jgi:hypothetical protein